jgi:tRNA threonylcarbamoyladenosine biosynthesis protein TsaB
MQRGHAEQLLPMIEAVRQQAGIDFEELDLLAVTIGPGTFTGVRVGLAAARALALVHDRPILGIGTLELLAQGVAKGEITAAPASDGGGIIAAIDARRGELYIQAFDANRRAVTEASARRLGPEILQSPAISSLTPGLIVGTGAVLLQALLPDWRSADGHEQPDAAVLALAAGGWQHRASRQAPAPLYLRAPDARLPSQTQNLSSPK